MGPDCRFDHSFAAQPVEVRAVLARLRRASVLRGVPPNAAQSCELVLAEAMNNIVEHAYAGAHGCLRLTLLRGRHHLICRLLDRGRPLPGLALPSARLPAQDDSPAEGGYGWFLIHSLSHRLHYRRTDGLNRLLIVVAANNLAA